MFAHYQEKARILAKLDAVPKEVPAFNLKMEEPEASRCNFVANGTPREAEDLQRVLVSFKNSLHTRIRNLQEVTTCFMIRRFLKTSTISGSRIFRM